MLKKFTLLALFPILLLSACTATMVSKDKAGEKAQKYVAKNILKEGIQSEILEVKSENGAYAVSLKIKQGEKDLEKVKVYVTKDGKYLALAPIFDMAKPIAAPADKAKEALKDIPKKDKPEVKMFVMAGCPYGIQAEQVFAPVMKALGKKVDFRPQYIIYPNYNGGGPDNCIDKNNKYCSMHGAEEAREGVRQICLWENNNEKWWDYISKFNEKCSIGKETANCSKGIAKELGIDFAKVESCLKDKGEALLAKEVETSTKFKAEGSPTIIINGSNYEGNRSPDSLLAAICSGFKKQPEECKTKLTNGEAAPAAKGGCGR